MVTTASCVPVSTLTLAHHEAEIWSALSNFKFYEYIEFTILDMDIDINIGNITEQDILKSICRLYSELSRVSFRANSRWSYTPAYFYFNGSTLFCKQT